MSAFKQFLTSDIIVSPLEVNKGFKFTLTDGIPLYGDAIYGDDYYGGTPEESIIIDRFKGVKGDFLTNKDTTGIDNTEYQVLIYDSIKELYYSNYLSSSLHSMASTSSIVPGADEAGNVLVGDVHTTNHHNYLGTDLTIPRFIPTSSGDIIGIISIPSRLFGDKLLPGSIRITSGGFTLLDDGEGTLYVDSTTPGSNYGNVIYEHGLITFTNSSSYTSGNGEGPSANVPSISSLIDDDISLEFSSSFEILETQYKTTIRENEFNFSLNPSLISGSEGDVYDFVTGSYFSPYVTTVGLYNDNQELLAVGKLSQPLPTSRTTDTNIFINIDR